MDDDRVPTTSEVRPGATPSDAEYSVAFTPRQLAGGFAILAALIVLVVGRRRRRRDKRDEG